MKRAIYLLAATALMASCTQEVLIDQPQPRPEKSRRIGFDTFVEKATRTEDLNLENPAALLNNFYTTFNVYGWKTVGNDVTCVFENIPVEYFTADTKGTVVYKNDNQKPSDEWTFAANSWYYENIRYWDKMASSYLFSAFTPTPAGVAFNCTSDGLIEIGSATAPVTVDDTNLLKDTPSTDLLFKGFKKDYMTAQSEEKSLDKVTLNFSHLQAKLNIRIKLDESVKTAQDVSIQKIQVHNLGDKGYYTNDDSGVSGWKLYTATATADEAGNTDDSGSADNNSGSTDDTAGDNSGAADNENATTSEYIPGIATPYSLNNATTNYNNHYVLEQLIIPQTIKKFTATTTEATAAVVTLPVSLIEYDEACVYVEYTIGEEIFKSYTPLANIFTTEPTYNFEGGNQYTLNITVGPKPIEFTATVDDWETAEANQDMD